MYVVKCYSLNYNYYTPIVVVCPVVETVSVAFAVVVGETSLLWWTDEVVRGKVADLLKSVHCANAIHRTAVLNSVNQVEEKEYRSKARTSAVLHQALKTHDNQSKFYYSFICNAIHYIFAHKSKQSKTKHKTYCRASLCEML